MASIVFSGSMIDWDYCPIHVLNDSKQYFTKIEKNRKRFNFVLEWSFNNNAQRHLITHSLQFLVNQILSKSLRNRLNIL